MKPRIRIFWFRRDLRLHDNHGLYQALKSELPVLGLFIFDSAILKKLEDKDDARVTFIHSELFSINQQLHELGSSLRVEHGVVLDIWKKLCAEFEIDSVFTNHDYEAYAIERDLKVEKFLLSQGAEFKSFKDQVIFEKDEVLKDDGSPYTVYTPYSKKWKALNLKHPIKIYPSEKETKNWFKAKKMDILSLESIGFKPSSIEIPKKTVSKSLLSAYKKSRDFPALEGTSGLGLHFRFGTISIRKAVQTATKESETWLNELIWREFFMMILFHFPESAGQPFKSKYAAIPWRDDEASFKTWCEGQTGYPIVDAGMRQLNQTGWMHNRVRMIVASFLTKHLLIDWRKGERYFARKLLDYELASNVGNWQWAAGCGCDAAPYFRVFNPMTQVEKFDSKEEYLDRWVPERHSSKYPAPMIEHKIGRERALRVFAEALKEKS